MLRDVARNIGGVLWGDFRWRRRFRLPVEQAQLVSVCAGDEYFSDRFLDAVGAWIFAGSELALHKNVAAFAYEPLSRLGRVPRQHHAVPFGVFLPYALSFGLPLFRGRHCEVSKFGSVAGGPDPRVCTKVAHQSDFVEIAHSEFSC